jgi:hypothetical protein
VEDCGRTVVSRERREGERGRTLDTVQELSCKVVDVLEGEGLILIVLEEVEDGGGEKFRDDADVPVVFEAVEQVNTVAGSVAC